MTTSLQKALEPMVHVFEVKHQRKCGHCSQWFEAVGLVGICETCEQKLPTTMQVRMRELGDTWPDRHRKKLKAMTGVGLDKAKTLLPFALTDGMIILAGDRGRGKTQIATWLAWQRGREGLRPGIYAKTFDLFCDVKASWSKQTKETEGGVMANYKTASFLALDECHERGETDWENRTLRNILDHRYDSRLPTVIIGNWATPDEVSTSLGASITDRITETGGIVWCRWESYRISSVVTPPPQSE